MAFRATKWATLSPSGGGRVGWRRWRECGAPRRGVLGSSGGGAPLGVQVGCPPGLTATGILLAGPAPEAAAGELWSGFLRWRWGWRRRGPTPTAVCSTVLNPLLARAGWAAIQVDRPRARSASNRRACRRHPGPSSRRRSGSLMAPRSGAPCDGLGVHLCWRGHAGRGLGRGRGHGTLGRAARGLEASDGLLLAVGALGSGSPSGIGRRWVA